MARASPNMVPVESTTLDAVGYDRDTRELYLRFVSGATYVYADVDAEIHDDLLAADSLGGYFNREIRPRYAYRQL